VVVVGESNDKMLFTVVPLTQCKQPHLLVASRKSHVTFNVLYKRELRFSEASLTAAHRNVEVTAANCRGRGSARRSSWTRFSTEL